MIEPKYKVKIEKNVLIPMRDGVNLAADLFLPDAEGSIDRMKTVPRDLI